MSKGIRNPHLRGQGSLVRSQFRKHDDLPNLPATEKRRDLYLIAQLESKLETMRDEHRLLEKEVADELYRAYRAEAGTPYDATAWFRITWRGPSGRLHKYPKRVHRVEGLWITKAGVILCPAIQGSVEKAVAVKQRKGR